jgi:hypothetical protein
VRGWPTVPKPDRYEVGVFDCAGRFHDETCPSFIDACMEAMHAAVKWPDKVILVANLDRADLNFDGLTDEERDIVGVVVVGARAIAARSKGVEIKEAV